MKTTNARRNAERGSQIAELAIVLPLLAFLAFVVSEGAGVVRAHQVINNAAREGSRLSAQPEYYQLPTAVKTAVADYACFNRTKLTGYSTNACPTTTTFNAVCTTSTITVDQTYIVTLPSGMNSPSSQVTVTCAYPLSYLPTLSYFFSSWGINIPSSIPLKATATFKNFYGV